MEQSPLGVHVSGHALPCTENGVNEFFVEKCSNTWVLLQISDSAFPTGGFCCSFGLEAAVKQGQVVNMETFKTFAVSCLQNAASFAMPYVGASHRQCHSLESILKLDHTVQAYMSNHVANRSSTRQGKSFLATCCKTFGSTAMKPLQDKVDQEELKGHFVTAFGFVCGLLELPLVQTQQMFLFSVLRSVLASAVRLGNIGPLEAQSIQFQLQKVAEKLRTQYTNLPVEEAAVTAPLADVLQGTHDNLFAKLFYS